MRRLLFSGFICLFFILLSSCNNTETYYGMDAARRFSDTGNPQAMIEKGDTIIFIWINQLTETKYEYTAISENGALDIDKCKLMVTKNCDVYKELAECFRLERIREINKGR